MSHTLGHNSTAGVRTQKLTHLDTVYRSGPFILYVDRTICRGSQISQSKNMWGQFYLDFLRIIVLQPFLLCRNSKFGPNGLIYQLFVDILQIFLICRYFVDLSFWQIFCRSLFYVDILQISLLCRYFVLYVYLI